MTSTITSPSTEITWQPEARVASVRYTTGAYLTAGDGDFLVDALVGWIGKASEPFGVLADASGLGGTNADYRAKASAFFREQRHAASIALFNMGPAIRVLTEMFRIGTGVPLKAFADEEAARTWLRQRASRDA